MRDGRSSTHCAPVVSWYGGREHPQCTRHTHTHIHTCIHTRGKFTNFGRLSRSLYPPTVGTLRVTHRHPTKRVVSLRLPLSSIPSTFPPPPPQIPPDPFARVCLYRTLWYMYAYVYTLSRDARNARASLTHTRESFLRRAPCRKYINRPHSRRYRQLLLPPSSRRWVNHRRVCPAC